MRYAETSQVRENMIGHRCRVKIRPEAGVLVAGFEPIRACAQRLTPGAGPGFTGTGRGGWEDPRVDETARIR